jgi:predicted ATPase
MKKIAINNFRKIKETWELDLAPVTFLVGTNNSGKSSILKALMLLDGFGNSKNHFILNLNGKHYRNHKIDCFSNAINRQNLKDNNFDINFSVDNKNYSINYTFYPLEDNDGKFEKGKLKFIEFVSKKNNSVLSIKNIANDEYQLSVDNSFIFGKNEDENKNENNLKMLLSFKKDIELIIQKNHFIIENSKDKFEQIRSTNEIKSYQLKLKEINKSISSLNDNKSNDLLNFNPTFKLSDYSGNESIDRILRRVLNKYFIDNKKNIGNSSSSELGRISILSEKLIDSLNLNITHLTPNRNTQTRLYVNENGSNDIHDIIKNHSESPIDKKSKAAKFLKDWMKTFDVGEDFKIKTIEGLASIIEIKEGNDWINLVDKGFGAGQIFTLLLHIATVINGLSTENDQKYLRRSRKTTPIIIVEEPEANLHPALQSKIAEMLYAVWFEFGIQFIVETHSEYIIRRSQLLFLDYLKTLENPNSLMPSHEVPIAVYYFDKDNGPYKMNYRNDGRFINEFGTGFFDVNSNLIFELP